MPPDIASAALASPGNGLHEALARLLSVLEMGGPAMLVIFIRSLASLALILWKIMRFVSLGAWSDQRGMAQALDLWTQGQHSEAMARVAGRSGLRFALLETAMATMLDPRFDQIAAEAETTRVARNLLARTRAGLRGLELVATIAPLLGLLGTVAGMIAAFQALQTAGGQADPAVLAGGTAADPYSGPPRLVELTSVAVRLNGEPVSLTQLIAGLSRLTDRPDDVIILKSGGNADVQAIVRVMEALAGHGFTQLVLAGP